MRECVCVCVGRVSERLCVCETVCVCVCVSGKCECAEVSVSARCLFKQSIQEPEQQHWQHPLCTQSYQHTHAPPDRQLSGYRVRRCGEGDTLRSKPPAPTLYSRQEAGSRS